MLGGARVEIVQARMMLMGESICTFVTDNVVDRRLTGSMGEGKGRYKNNTDIYAYFEGQYFENGRPPTKWTVCGCEGS